MRQNLFLTFVAMTMAVCPGAMAQDGQTPTNGSSYYIRNVYTNQYLCQDGIQPNRLGQQLMLEQVVLPALAG